MPGNSGDKLVNSFALIIFLYMRSTPLDMHFATKLTLTSMLGRQKTPIKDSNPLLSGSHKLIIPTEEKMQED